MDDDWDEDNGDFNDAHLDDNNVRYFRELLNPSLQEKIF
jgi:hypothetical protein